ncbi:FadR/GntR family transcriptional regulator [Agarivorans sp.]|uniref:FadR/GntR family transcriptional regulator n=1 Tax=Agarivorans sp. TaxID=1872412 RepID=UPI003CFF3BF2
MANQFAMIEGASRSLHLQVAREIAKRILSGALPQNSIIPSEMELCEQFGVSRTALREAIKHLSSKGLLESRPKIGTRVKSREHWNMLDSQLLSWMAGLGDVNKTLNQFLALRRAIEPEAAALAAKHASAEQRVQLSEYYQQMLSLMESDKPSEWFAADLQFHRLIYLATGNNFYIPFANVLQVMYQGFAGHFSQDDDDSMKLHTLMYQAIMAGDQEKARQNCLALLTLTTQRIPELELA